MSAKLRLSVSVDANLIDAVSQAVARGHSSSISAWVNEALRTRLAQDRRLEALRNFIAVYESEHGEITYDEMQVAARRARSGAVVVRGPRGATTGPTGPRRRVR